MSDNWVVQNLEHSLETWNGKLQEIWNLLTMSPTYFKGGAIWKVIERIFNSLQAIGFALLVLFFVIGVVKTCTSWEEVRRPEKAIKLFLRFVIAKGIVTYGMTFLMDMMTIVQGIISNIMSASGISKISASTLPSSIIKAIEDCGFWESIPLWAVTLIGSLFITILSFLMILTVYGRFFKIFMYAAISPIPLSTFAGENTQNVGKQFLKSFCGVLLEGGIIILACIIFSVFASSPPVIKAGVSAVNIVWAYVGELCFNMLVLVGAVKMSDRIVKEMMGL